MPKLVKTFAILLFVFAGVYIANGFAEGQRYEAGIMATLMIVSGIGVLERCSWVRRLLGVLIVLSGIWYALTFSTFSLEAHRFILQTGWFKHFKEFLWVFLAMGTALYWDYCKMKK